MESLFNNFLIAISSGLAAISWFLIRRNHILSENAGTTESSVRARDNEIQSLISKREEEDKAHKETLVNLKKEHNRELASLNDEINNLNEIISHNDNPIDFISPH